MDRINAIARKHNLKVIEDACEAHGGEWKGRKVGTLGDLGCFSFQNGKSLTCGEGGAILASDAKLMDRCFSFQIMGRPHGAIASPHGEGHPILGTKCRMASTRHPYCLPRCPHLKRRANSAAKTRNI